LVEEEIKPFLECIYTALLLPRWKSRLEEAITENNVSRALDAIETMREYIGFINACAQVEKEPLIKKKVSGIRDSLVAVRKYVLAKEWENAIKEAKALF